MWRWGCSICLLRGKNAHEDSQNITNQTFVNHTHKPPTKKHLVISHTYCCVSVRGLHDWQYLCDIQEGRICEFFMNFCVCLCPLGRLSCLASERSVHLDPEALYKLKGSAFVLSGGEIQGPIGKVSRVWGILPRKCISAEGFGKLRLSEILDILESNMQPAKSLLKTKERQHCINIFPQLFYLFMTCC